ncbi:unnamed protein product [Mytilus coruscus]|uniref:UMOD/GP2/OIT3-like D8C domain-containing protein n=1 Tax=Mytilus coruscus TaxID=42192 RepID=A0A6J8EIU5_MYTCO|nr:unnamed protein product [Mytilus coruscus]
MFKEIYFVILIIHIFLSVAEFYACSNYTLMKYVDRRAVANVLDHGNVHAISDDFLDSGWYRIQSEAGEDMPTEPPGSFHCGTWYPIWLNGSLPTNIGEEIVGRVCLQSFDDNCSESWTIDIKYCPGNYLVYNLVTSISSSSGYCFGTEASRATVETSSTSVVINTNNPTNGTVDPCNDFNLVQYPNRRAATRILNFGEETAISDDFFDNGWYRVEKSTCEKMPTSAPGPFHCGTWYPIWLNGQLPTAKGEQIRQTMCMQSFTHKCLYSWDVDIKLCDGDYFVYNLTTSTTPLSGYCFGTLEMCAEKGEDESEPPKENSENEKKEQTTGHAIIALIVVLSAVIVILSILLVVYCRRSKRSETNGTGIPFSGKTIKTGNSPPLYKRDPSYANFLSRTCYDNPPQYLSREPSVASIGSVVPDRKLTPV